MPSIGILRSNGEGKAVDVDGQGTIPIESKNDKTMF